MLDECLPDGASASQEGAGRLTALSTARSSEPVLGSRRASVSAPCRFDKRYVGNHESDHLGSRRSTGTEGCPARPSSLVPTKTQYGARRPIAIPVDRRARVQLRVDFIWCNLII